MSFSKSTVSMIMAENLLSCLGAGGAGGAGVIPSCFMPGPRLSFVGEP